MQDWTTSTRTFFCLWSDVLSAPPMVLSGVRDATLLPPPLSPAQDVRGLAQTNILSHHLLPLSHGSRHFLAQRGSGPSAGTEHPRLRGGGDQQPGRCLGAAVDVQIVGLLANEDEDEDDDVSFCSPIARELPLGELFSAPLSSTLLLSLSM